MITYQTQSHSVQEGSYVQTLYGMAASVNDILEEMRPGLEQLYRDTVNHAQDPEESADNYYFPQGRDDAGADRVKRVVRVLEGYVQSREKAGCLGSSCSPRCSHAPSTAAHPSSQPSDN